MENIEIPYKFLTKSNTHYSIDFGNYTLEIKVVPEQNDSGRQAHVHHVHGDLFSHDRKQHPVLSENHSEYQHHS